MLLTNIFGQKNGLLFKAAKGIAGINALPKVDIEKGTDATQFFILSNMDTFVHQNLTVIPKIIPDANGVTEGQTRRMRLIEANPFGDKNDIIIFRKGKNFDPHDTDFFRLHDAGAPGISQLVFAQGLALLHDNNFLFLRPGVGDRQEDRKGG